MRETKIRSAEIRERQELKKKKDEIKTVVRFLKHFIKHDHYVIPSKLL